MIPSHRSSYSVEYKAWTAMKGRCHNPNNEAYANYGALGVVVCNEWRQSFTAFYDYIGPRPSAQHSLDRYPNNQGNYEPGNVRWATVKEQTSNRRKKYRKRR